METTIKYAVFPDSWQMIVFGAKPFDQLLGDRLSAARGVHNTAKHGSGDKDHCHGCNKRADAAGKRSKKCAYKAIGGEKSKECSAQNRNKSLVDSFKNQKGEQSKCQYQSDTR